MAKNPLECPTRAVEWCGHAAYAAHPLASVRHRSWLVTEPIPILKFIFIKLTVIVPTPLVFTGERNTFQLRCKPIIWCLISDIRYIMLDSALFIPISEVLISGSVWYRWSRISELVPIYGRNHRMLTQYYCWAAGKGNLLVTCLWSDSPRNRFLVLLQATHFSFFSMIV